MKSTLTILLLVALLPLHLSAQEENVLSYYAVGNSLDGQPMVDMTNLMRFYPVYAMRDMTDSVRVTIYYGPHVYTRNADRQENGRYWQVLLPQFRLGEAIQRVEVETYVNLDKHPVLKYLYEKLEEAKQKVKIAVNDLTESSGRLQARVNAQLTTLPELIAEELRPHLLASPSPGINTILEHTHTESDRESLEQLLCMLKDLCRQFRQPCNCISSSVEGDFSRVLKAVEAQLKSSAKRDKGTASAEEIGKEKQEIQTLVGTALNTMAPGFIKKFQDSLTATLIEPVERAGKGLTEFLGLQDTLRKLIASESFELLIDTNFAGPGVRKADVFFDPNDPSKTRVLYRNYKTSLRSLPALDPAERMGIFRLRYVPFVIRGKQYHATFTGDQSAVFELGLGFSDVAISGDDFVRPELSIRRLGVAFAITRHLFDTTATIRALAFTYDFNAYGSIALGANFPGSGGTESYMSFGINKKAFEEVLAGLSSLFE